MNFQNNYIAEPACESDAEGINLLFSSQSFGGKIAVAYLRNPDTLRSYEREGERIVMIVLKDRNEGDKIIGMGGCVIRSCLISGKVRRAGYLTGLKLLPEYQKKISFIPILYQEMHRLTGELVDIYYTTILSGNETVRIMLEKKRKSMPEYRYMGLYHTYFCKTGKSYKNSLRKIKNSFVTKKISKDEANAFYAGLAKGGEKGVLAPSFALQDDLKNGMFYGVYDKGTLLAAGYALDQRSYKQYVVHHYEGAYCLLSRLPVSLAGYPPFPKPGQTANCASAAIWYDSTWLKNSSLAFPALQTLWQGMLELSVKHQFLIIGCHESSSLFPLFKKEKKIDYSSRFYQVLWNGEKALPKDVEIQAEVAFL